MESEQTEELQMELLATLQRKDLEAFRDLLRGGRVDPNHRYGAPHYGTCLEIAARRSFGSDFVKELLAYVKPNVNTIVPEPIHHAAKRGFADVLDVLLSDKRTKVNAHDSEGRTALHFACMNVTLANVRGYERCVKQLMGRMSPADINRTDVHGFSAIHAAAKAKPKAKSLQREDSVAEGNGVGDAVTETADDMWQAREQIIKVMLDVARGVLDVDSVRAKGRTAREDILGRFPELERKLPAGADALHADPHSALASALRDGRIELFRALLQETDPDGNPTLDPNHWFGAPLHATCLEIACKKRDGHRFVEALLAAGADPNTSNKLDEKFPIHLACERGHSKQLRALFLGCDATDPNARDRRGNTALHLLVEKWSNEKRDCLKILLSHKNLDVNRRNKNSLTALMLAIEYEIKCVVKSIIEEKRDSLDLNANFGEKTLREKIIEIFPEFENLVPESEMALPREDEIEWFDLLHTTREREFVNEIRNNTPHNLSMNDKKFTLLQRAARYGMEKAVKVLLEKGANPNETFKGNLSPPGVLATFYRHGGIVKTLLEHPEFNVNAVDAKGNSALHYAARDGRNVDIVILLLRRGADFEIKNKLGKTPLGKNEVHNLLDQCVHTNGKNAQDEDYELVIDYSMLAPGRDDQSELLSSHYETIPRDENQITVETEGKNDDLESEMCFLHAMCKDDELSSLLDHPVARSFLELKWSRVRPIAYFNFGVYVAFVAFLNIYIINSGSIDVFEKNTTEEIFNSTSSEDETAIFMSISFSEVLAWFSLCVSMLLWLLLVLREVVQFAFDQRKYIGSVENYLDWTILLFSLVSLAMPVFQSENSLLSTIHVITIMLSCAELLFLMGRLSHFAKYIEMLKVVLHSYFLPLVSYCIIIVAFGLSFHTLFHQGEEIGNNNDNNTLSEYIAEETEKSTKDFDFWYTSIIKSLVMMTGELDFDNYPDRSLLSIALFVMFVLLVTVVLLNLLIGLAVNDTQRIENMAEQLRLKTRVELVLFTESILVNMHNSKWRLLKKLSSLLLWEKFQGAILFPWRKLDGRKAWVKPNQSAELVLAQEHGPGTRRRVPKELLDRATQIISRRSCQEVDKAYAVSLADLDAKLQRVLQMLAARGVTEEHLQMQVDGNGSYNPSEAPVSPAPAPDGDAPSAATTPRRRLSSNVFFPEGESEDI